MIGNNNMESIMIKIREHLKPTTHDYNRTWEKIEEHYNTKNFESEKKTNIGKK
jgi:hypothetical protein